MDFVVSVHRSSLRTVLAKPLIGSAAIRVLGVVLLVPMVSAFPTISLAEKCDGTPKGCTRNISAYTLNLFHEVLARECLPSDVEISYHGPLQALRGCLGSWTERNTPKYLIWSLFDVNYDKYLCTFRLTCHREKTSFVSFTIDGQRLYISLDKGSPEPDFEKPFWYSRTTLKSIFLRLPKAKWLGEEKKKSGKPDSSKPE